MKAVRHTFVVIVALISIAYLLNIGAGFIELIPDNIPFVGNLDEAGASYLLYLCLTYFGFSPRIAPDQLKRKQ